MPPPWVSPRHALQRSAARPPPDTPSKVLALYKHLKARKPCGPETGGLGKVDYAEICSHMSLLDSSGAAEDDESESGGGTPSSAPSGLSGTCPVFVRL